VSRFRNKNGLAFSTGCSEAFAAHDDPPWTDTIPRFSPICLCEIHSDYLPLTEARRHGDTESD